MRHEHLQPKASRSIFTRRRFQLLGALVFAALLPYFLRYLDFPEFKFEELRGSNALTGNVAAVVLAMWMRLSIGTYPGIRSGLIILPTTVAAHVLVIVYFFMTQIGYDRVALTLGFGFHVLWNYAIWFIGERRIRSQIAIVPFGEVNRLQQIRQVDWVVLQDPRFDQVAGCQAIVADFSADMPDEWEAFLADAALDGRIVYQVKQLSESLTGRVELTHLSENNFGSLVPARGYFHLKTVIDFAFALLVLPFALLVMAMAAIAIRLDSRGPVLFRQKRVGHAGRLITVYKFRTMRPAAEGDQREAAITAANDDRVTRAGRFLRRTRIDELPQIINVLKGEMSWIGPRPEAEVLSLWYTSELPFYRYRHVVKPGISGWAQVNQGHVADVAEVHRKLQYDFYYIKYFSPWLDLLIFFKTLVTMTSGFGAR